MRKENMDDLESRAIENIHDYLKECLDRNNCKVDLAGAREDINDVSLIHSSLKKYVVRLVNINNFIKQENYFLKKKNEQLIKKCNERDAFDFYKNEKGTRRVHRTHEPIQTHGTHAMCMNEMHKLSDENEFIKYKYEQMLRENLSLNENNAQMNNTLLNMHKHEPHTNGENRKVKIENAFLSQSPNQLWPHQDEGRNILGRRNEIDGNTQPSQVNYMTFEQKINKILKCTRILEDILSMLNKNFKYDEPLMFQKKMNLMEVEKAELIMQNDFLKEKILQIETFILNDPFLVEKFNFFYDSASFNLDPSIRDNLELYKNNSTKMMFHKLRRSQSTNADLKQQLSSEKKKSLIYRTYMYDMREKLKDHLSELLKLNKDQNMNYYNLHQCNDSIHHFSENGSSVPWKMFYDHRNNQEEDELSRREHPEYYNYLSDLSTPNFYRLFKINSSKIDHNEKRLTQSWNRIRELNQDARCFQKRRFEQICRQYEDDAILAELENDMQNEVYYFRIKKLISMRKKELDGMLQSGRRQLASQKRKDSSKLRNEMYLNRMEYKEALRKWLRSKEKTLHTSDNHRNTHLKDDLPSGNRNIDQLNLYIKRKISYQFVKYKHIYEYFVQNKGVCKKQISKEKFINFFNKHILHLQNCDTAQCSYRGTPGDGERRIIKSCQKGKVSHNDESNKKRGSAYVEEDNTQYHDVTLEDHGRRGSHHSEESTLRSYRPRVEPIEAAGRKKGDAKREKQREAKGRKQREIKAVEEKQRKIEAEMVRQRKMEKEKQRKMEKEKHRKMEKKKQRKMEKRKQREMEKDKQREEERASNVDRDPPHTEKQAGEEENHDKSNIHIEPSSDNSQEEKMGRENLKKNDQMSEKFYMPEEHPRRHDSSLEALINTIKNINKNKIQENMTSKSIEDLFTSTNSMDERDQSSLIEESPQKERRASNFSKKDSSQRIVESMKSSKSLDVEPIEGEINKGEGGASDLEEFSFDHVKSDTSNSVDEEDEKKSQFSNLSIEPEKEDHIGGEDNPERVVNRGEWENHVGATAQVPARLSVKQKTIVGGSVPLDEIKRVNTMRGVGVSELIHPEEDAQKEEFESGPGKDSHEGELRKDDVLDEPNRDSDQNELPPNVDQSEIPPNVDQGASPPDEEIMHSIRATDKREKPPPKPFYNENFLESGSEYSEHDLFDNSKYANVKIQAFRQMLHLHDKNVYTFFMNLIVHSKINLVRDYKNKVFNAKVMAGDILEYLLKNYFEADKSSVKGEVRKEGSHMQGHLTEVELKHINEYICNNSNSSSLKTLYHKILFLNNENYESFKNRLLEGGVINLINLFQDEDISNFDKIFDVSFVNFCDIVGISKDTCTYHFNRMDKNYKGKRYIYLRHIFRYLEVERDMKEELHKYNFISMQKKNLIYIHISESFDNVNEFFKSVEKKNKLYISVNEFIYFFSENEKMRVHSYTQEDVISLYYSILFYVYYTNKNKVLQTLEFCGEKKGGEENDPQKTGPTGQNDNNRKESPGANTSVGTNPLVKENAENRLIPDDGYNYVNQNLSQYKEYFSLDDFNFAIELKDLYFYFEGSECPFSKIKRRIVEIYGSVKKGLIINHETCNNERDTDDTSSTQSDKDEKSDLDSDLQLDSFQLFMRNRYRYKHCDRVFFHEREAKKGKQEKSAKVGKVTKLDGEDKADSLQEEGTVPPISKKTFMCLMYNIGIHVNHCLTLWKSFAPFLEYEKLDYKIFCGFLNGKITIESHETEEGIKGIKNKLINTKEEKEVDPMCNYKNRLGGTICPCLLSNLNEKDSTQPLTIDEIEVLVQVLNHVTPFNFLDKNEKKNFIQNLKKECFKKGYDFISLMGRDVKIGEKEEISKGEATGNFYQNNTIFILLNGILRHTTKANSFINSINVIDRVNMHSYTAHTNVALIEVNKELYTKDFINLVEQKREVSEEFMTIINDIPILKNFPDAIKNSLSMNVQKCKYKKKKVIIRQHDDPTHFYILKEGEIHFYCNGVMSTPVKVISRCSFFGEVSLIFNTLRTCDAVVESDVAHCYCISKEYFLSLLNKEIVKEFVEYFRTHYTEGIQHIIKNYSSGNIGAEGTPFEEDNNGGNHPKGANILQKVPSDGGEIPIDIKKSSSRIYTKQLSTIGTLSRKFSSVALSADNITLDVEYINQSNIGSFYSDLDKILLKFFNTEQKYFVEEMESHLMKVKVLKDVLNKMKDKKAFLKHLKWEKCPKGKHIILEGDFFDKFYFVKEGEISVQQFNQYKNVYEEISTVKKNQYFGHQLIMDRTKSSFIAVASVDTELYTLEASLYEQFLAPFIDTLNKKSDINHTDELTESINNRVMMMKKDDEFVIKVIRILKKVSVVQKLNDDQMYNGAKHFNFKFFRKGAVIIRNNDHPDHFYIIKKGIVSVKVDDKEVEDVVNQMNNVHSTDNQQEDRSTLTNGRKKSVYLYKYDYFGELSIINNQLRTATCEAHTNCYLLAIDKLSFIEHFGIIFNELLQEADIRYTKNYTLPPWLKSMYGNGEINEEFHSVSMKIPELGSSLSSISDDSNEMFSFEKEINAKLKREKRNKRKGRGKLKDHNAYNANDENNADDAKNEDMDDDPLAESENDVEHATSQNLSTKRSLSIVNNEDKIKKIKEEKRQKMEEIKQKELKVFERIKQKEERKIKALMKKKGILIPGNVAKKEIILAQPSSNTRGDQEEGGASEKEDETKMISVNPESKEKEKQNQTKDNKEANSIQHKSSSILKKKMSPANSSELKIDKMVKKLLGVICSEYNSIFHFYECIDKFNTGYIKYNDFVNFIMSQHLEELFEGRDNMESLFKYLCDEKSILTLTQFYISMYKDKQIDMYSLNLRLCEVYGSSLLAFKKIVPQFNTQDDSLCSFSNFELVCDSVGISKSNIKNIWDEINIMNEEQIPLEIVFSILNGEVSVEQAYITYNEKKSLLNQVVHFFQGNEEDITKMSTQVLETTFKINYEEPIIINKCHHKSCSKECQELVKLLQSDIHFKYLTMDQRIFFSTLMNRKVMNSGDVLTNQGDYDAPIIFLYQGTANIISQNIFGIETVIREIENYELYGCYEAIEGTPADYQVKITSDNSVVWILDRSSYRDNLKDMLEERKQNCLHIFALLKNVPILRYFPEETLHNLSYAMKVEHYQPNHTIIKENTHDDKFYIICKGLATVEKNSEINKNRLILSTLRRADYFGEMALIKNIRRTANVVLDTQTILLSLVDVEFHRLLTPYFDQFLNRAKANYKKLHLNIELVPAEIAKISSNPNIGNVSLGRGAKKKVTIQGFDEGDSPVEDPWGKKKGEVSFVQSAEETPPLDGEATQRSRDNQEGDRKKGDHNKHSGKAKDKGMSRTKKGKEHRLQRRHEEGAEGTEKKRERKKKMHTHEEVPR
ncbi:rap guanine nucleotide exchange factor, putative [Plasmodium knowlesi strain H]|uniref:Rap guanine nucleotide exchange factor, putative n=3 Tax=Plasmodium knowlesi TaxID=5850 RepID=A0A5E7X5I3_PLAKH|nr:rap guanine nucleotide exchange factor, putative [Plasmodium knowlesi strain H]OTN67770.1 putative Rap guanine nucleotide exchange factor [Plasmodium knowlesi]CAA9990431.1 rap guanine nucleotide exchange factor, putative [Plasmodium knowlesi strain H]SBO19637.1 rap guanine nucleotide exchange factor, putative [Plasmodium knowlesi strain H]SBO22559.1 rap guanine nucleotide exchange factor, putative [Plasmodium knowlesi strain H]VVS79905.1 rap guanine nucleotide exchange factor, putative [Pla